MAQLAMHGPLDEPDLNDDLRTHPVSLAGKAFRFRERRLVDGDGVEPLSQVEQELCVEARADLAGEDEVAIMVIPDEKRAETHARALRIGESADDELLCGLDLHLQPVLRAAMLIRRSPALGDDPFPTFAAGALPRLRVVEELDASQGRFKRERLKKRATLLEGQRGHGVAVQPEDVEHVIAALSIPGDLAVENRLVDGKFADRGGYCGAVLGQPIAGKELNVISPLVREQPDAVVLLLEEP